MPVSHEQTQILTAGVENGTMGKDDWAWRCVT